MMWEPKQTNIVCQDLWWNFLPVVASTAGSALDNYTINVGGQLEVSSPQDFGLVILRADTSHVGGQPINVGGYWIVRSFSPTNSWQSVCHVVGLWYNSS